MNKRHSWIIVLDQLPLEKKDQMNSIRTEAGSAGAERVTGAHSPADVSGANEDPPVRAGKRVIPNFVPHAIDVQVISAQHVSVASTHCRRRTNGQNTNEESNSSERKHT